VVRPRPYEGADASSGLKQSLCQRGGSRMPIGRNAGIERAAMKFLEPAA